MPNEKLRTLFPSKESARIAALPDDKFKEEANDAINALSSGLRIHAQNLVDGIDTNLTLKPRRVVFIPTSHIPAVPAQDRRIKLEIGSILNEIGKPKSLIANAESSNEIQTRSLIIENDREVMRRAEELGVIDDQFSIGLQRQRGLTFMGYESAIVEYANTHRGTRAVGVDSFDGRIIGMLVVIQATNGVTMPQEDYTKVSSYLCQEARTRLALNRACSYLQEGDDLIFVQGADHHFGVEQWCQRNEIPYEQAIPPAINKLARDLKNPLSRIRLLIT